VSIRPRRRRWSHANEIDADFDRAYAELLGAMQKRDEATHVPAE